MFKGFHVGQKLADELSRPFIKSECHKNSVSFNIYTVRKWEIFKACFAREWLLIKHNSFVYVFKSAQVRTEYDNPFMFVIMQMIGCIEINKFNITGCFHHAACRHCPDYSDSVHTYSDES